MNTEEHDFVEQLVESIKAELEAALHAGDRNKARLLLRLCAALVPSNVLHASTVLKVLQGVVEDVIEIADQGQASATNTVPLTMQISTLHLLLSLSTPAYAYDRIPT